MRSTSTNKRILAKCFTYRIMSLCLTMCIVWIVTGSMKGVLSIGFLDFFVKMGFQFGHEKIWKLTTWGKTYHLEEK